MAISFLFFLPFVSSAVDFDFSYPSSVRLNESFVVSISSNTSDVYDVKIYVHDDTKEFSEIFDGTEWKSTFNYLLSAFPSRKDFQLISHYLGTTNICTKLRKSGSTTDITTKCNNITIQEQQIPPQQNQTFQNTTQNQTIQNNQANQTNSSQNQSSDLSNLPQDNSDGEDDDENQQSRDSSFTTSGTISDIPQSSGSSNSSKIILNSKKDSSSSPSSFISKKEIVRTAVLYSFTIFCIFIIILLALRRL